MKTKHILLITVGIATLQFLSSCKKDFLNTKPDASLVVPVMLSDFQALLDNVSFMNGNTPGTFGIQFSYGGPNPMLLEIATDNYYVSTDLFNQLFLYSKQVYLWSKDDPYGGEINLTDWSFPYRTVFYSNIVLDGLNENNQSANNNNDFNNIKGSALFYRAHSFYQLAQVYAPLYEETNARNLVGIPLRLSSDINEKIKRATLFETYNLIISDLKQASDLLPNLPTIKTRPSVAAAYGLLSRVYLSMSDFENSKKYAKLCIENYSGKLLDFNTLKSSSTYPISRFNEEVIFSSITNNLPWNELTAPSIARTDSLLYKSYVSNDLRKDIFFRLREPNAYSYRGSYDGTSGLFFGIALDEVYLTMAESSIRTHNISIGLFYLNELLKMRFKVIGGKNTFINYDLNNEDEALSVVLTERRKELIGRGLRWTDLKRLNKDVRFAKNLQRNVNGKVYELGPNDLRYVWPIPNEVIAITGIPQNPR